MYEIRHIRAFLAAFFGLMKFQSVSFFEPTDVPTLHGAEPVLDAGPLAHVDLADTR
jgi:hypothetical protein